MTDIRTAANTRNARRSTGPTTPEGKARSSKNALKHGLTSRDVVLPNEDPADFQARLTDWTDYYRPDDPAQTAVIERAVAAKWKLDRIARLETARLAEKVRHAADRYDLAAYTAAEELGRRLIYEPMNRSEFVKLADPALRQRLARRVADNQTVLARAMQTTSQGAQWLLDRWAELAAMLEFHGYWHYPERLRALWLLGKNPEDVVEDATVRRVTLACNALHPDSGEDDPKRFGFGDDCCVSALGMVDRPMYPAQIEAIRAQQPADPAAALAEIRAVIADEVHRLRVLKETHLDPIDAADRAEAGERAMFDGSKEGVLLRRYETACERELHRSIADLVTLRKQPVPERVETAERNEPIAQTPVNEIVTSGDDSDPSGGSAPEGSPVPSNALVPNARPVVVPILSRVGPL